MDIQSTVEMPKFIDDGRLDGLLEIIKNIKTGHELTLSFVKTENITPAGHAILFALLEIASEQKIKLKIQNVKKNLKLHSVFLSLQNTTTVLNGFFKIETLRMQEDKFLVYGKSSGIAPEFLIQLEEKFKNILSEDVLWNISLIINELMQNTVDHSTAERYFIYAGVNKDHFEFGILDMGVTIPAKLETKYQCSSDEEYLEKVFEKGVGTRRDRAGGLGLYYLFENIKDLKGRLVVLSRNAQVRKNFGSRNYKTTKLKYKLSGTWCMASIPLEQL